MEKTPKELIGQQEDVNLEDIKRKAEETLEEMKKFPIIAEALKSVESNTPKELRYHSPAHTLDVLYEVILFATYDGLDEEKIKLLAIAAANHDRGFVISRKQNEKIGAGYAKKDMQKFGYIQEDIEAVVQMIEDTEMRVQNGTLVQISRSELGGYLLDADLSNFGRTDFKKKLDLMLEENGIQDKKGFMARVLGMMEAHQWQTNAAKNLRQEQKEANISKLKEEISRIS